MKFSSAACLLLVSSAQAFVPAAHQRTSVVRFMADETEAPAPAPAKAPAPAGALVPIKQETVEFTAGILGGVAGFAVGGPVLGALTAAAANYVSKMDGDVSDVIQAVSKTSIQVFNYLAGLDAKYEVLNKAKASLEKSLDSLKKQESVDPETVEKVEKALKNTKSKIAEINDEYDLVGGTTTALGVVGELVEKAIKKAGELNEEYKLTSKATESLKTAVDKAKSAAKDAAN
eukprot:scaffold34685_cov183-Amphora_coffeaeformis.AAC.26